MPGETKVAPNVSYYSNFFILENLKNEELGLKNLYVGLGKTHKKIVFFSGRTTKVLPPPPNGLVVHATFFFLLLFLVLEKPETDFDNLFFPQF